MPRGFTLIELLIVVAILGVMAAIVLVLINPTEKLASSKDVGRISVIVQLGKSVESYYITHQSMFPAEADWGNDLVSTGFPNTFPSGTSYLPYYGVTPCTANALPASVPTYCYRLDSVSGNGVLIFAKLEAKLKRDACVSGAPYFVYSTADNRAGTICATSDPIPWSTGSMTYLD